ncbi:MAG: hypothetical protein WCY24_08020 [Lutispora sp.]|nr:hypothetical protein [Lutispora sp.]
MNIELVGKQISNFNRFLKDWSDYIYISDENINLLYDELDSIEKNFNTVINRDYLEDIDGHDFKNGFVEKYVWAISDGAPDIKKMFKGNVNGERFKDGVLEMIDLAEREQDMNKIIEPALEALKFMPNKISIATEILHKCIPSKFPIKNYKSNWGLALTLEHIRFVDYVRHIPYDYFTKYLDLLFEVMVIHFEKNNIELKGYYKYWLIDRVFWYLVDNKYREVIKMYNSRNEYY